MMSSDEFSLYYWAVAEAACKMGYNASQVAIFSSDIQDYFDQGKSVNECLEEVF